MRNGWAWLFLSLLCSTAALADHGHGHDDHHVAPPAPSPIIQNTVQPPIVQPPPPVVHLPRIAPSSTILPTDTAGFHNVLKPQPLSKEEIAALTTADPRYKFSGEWIPFSSYYSSENDRSQKYYRQVAYTALPTAQFGHIERNEPSSKSAGEPLFMPTVDAAFSKIGNDHLKLRDGAIIVRSGDHPVFVSTSVNGKRLMTRLSGGSLVMISGFDSKSIVLNLTDKCCGAVALYLPAKQTNSNTMNMLAGQIAEVYSLNSKPNSNLVATEIAVNHRIGVSDLGLLISDCHYIRAIKRFNLSTVLPKHEMERVLKTAAALAYTRFGR